MRRLAFSLLLPVAPVECSRGRRLPHHPRPRWPRRRIQSQYAQIRERGERVIIDGICNSACTLVLGIVPLNRVCVTPRASLGFHMAYYDKATTFGIKVTSYAGTADLMSYYPETVKDWISRHGGLTTDMKKVKNGPELWAIIDPCPEEFF